MTGPRAPSSANSLAFEFVSLLARELSEGKVELPGFPHVFARVCRAIDDPEISAEKMAGIVGAEPGLAVRLMAAANSVAFNPAHQPVGDLPAAIVRLGAINVRSAASAFAIAQLRHSAALQSVAPHLEKLWERSTQVAAVCYVVAAASKINADEAFLAGLLHGIGELYVLARMSERADLLSTSEEVHAILGNWHAPIGKSLLENWMFPDHIVEAVEEQDNAARRPHAQADVADALICAKVLYVSGRDADEIRQQSSANRAFRQLRLDAERSAAILVEAAGEIGALRAIVGG
jgi:HD-like signal output (HDOD) protein